MKADTRHKIVSSDRLFLLRKQWARARKKVVFTNGVFDLLHAGHVDLLEKARALGDALIVGVNTDASAKRLGKGPERPINHVKDRVRLLAALACVDAVCPFSEDTPEKILSRLKPDILVKGADYRPGQVAGQEHARKLRLIRLKKGYSTTALVRRILTAHGGGTSSRYRSVGRILTAHGGGALSKDDWKRHSLAGKLGHTSSRYRSVGRSRR